MATSTEYFCRITTRTKTMTTWTVTATRQRALIHSTVRPRPSPTHSGGFIIGTLMKVSYL